MSERRIKTMHICNYGNPVEQMLDRRFARPQQRRRGQHRDPE